MLLKQDEEGKVGNEVEGEKETHHQKSSQEQGMIDQPPPGSKMILQLEFRHVQLSCLSNISEGGVLISLDNGTLYEHFNEHEHIRMMSLKCNNVHLLLLFIIIK